MINQEKTEHDLINKTTQEWRMCKYFGSMLDTKKDIKWRNAVNAANIIQVIFNNTKLTPEKKRQLSEPISNISSSKTWNLDNNIFSGRKHHKCISAKTNKNICAKCEMAEYRQKWRGIQKKKSHKIEHHRLKQTVEMIWEGNQSRQFNTCKEGHCPIPETLWQTSINLMLYEKYFCVETKHWRCTKNIFVLKQNINVAQNVIWCWQKRVDVARKSV